MEKIIKKIDDYKPLFWQPNKTFLEFLIFKEYTVVKSQIYFEKNKINSGNKFNLKSQLELNGVDLNTKKFEIKIDENKPKKVKINELKKKNEAIIIPVPIKSSSVKIHTEVAIFPKKNTTLEGLYESKNMLCTQCEPEGFRKITWFPDRPDCLSVFTVRIETSDKFKTILSNGNLIEDGKLKNKQINRIFKVWHDPFPKPSYLFALVVGNLEASVSKFITTSKKEIEIKIFTEIGKKHLTNYAMNSLKRAMKWDEEKYGLEYDLKTFMIVAVSHFNMGAMENKGLNIFNSKFVLADSKTATDKDLQNIESIVAHEYFHNWTGNRVTCRDWFQLTLKEGLTVFRDQEFSADFNNRGVKRIEDVSLLRSVQFAEDAGSNSHPIRPNSYKEINNFYTPTVYEKGAEVIRMIFNVVGDKGYKNGIDLYFKRFDGKAVTCEHFMDALSEGSKLDLSLFKQWYSQSGTPNLYIKRKVNKNVLELTFSQQINKKDSNLPIPIKIAFLNKEGSLAKFKLNKSKLKSEHLFLLTKSNDKVSVICDDEDIVPSILRSFSAPIILKTDIKINEYIRILNFDNDAFNKWDASQNLYQHYFFKSSNLRTLTNILKKLILEERVDYSLMALLFELPSRTTLENLLDITDPIETFIRKNDFMKKIALDLQEVLESFALKLSKNKIYYKNKVGERALLQKLLNLLLLINSKIGIQIAQKISENNNMTLSIIGLKSLCLSDGARALKYLNKFYKKWEGNELVIEKWFEIMSTLNIKGEGINFIKKLLKHSAFDYKNPNKLRSVLNTFQRENILLFHANDSSGYNFVSEQISEIDKHNPQAAARLILPLTRFNNYTNERKKKIKKVLQNIIDKSVSTDLSEIIEKALI